MTPMLYFPPTDLFHCNLILSCDEGIDGEDISATESRDSRRPAFRVRWHHPEMNVPLCLEKQRITLPNFSPMVR